MLEDEDLEKKTSRKNARSTKRTAVLVLGMHRSGTSAVARVLNLLGCDLPGNLMPAAPFNEAGHWESTAIQKLNDQILDSAGSAWHDWQPFYEGWYHSPKVEQFRDKVIAAVAEEFGASNLFVLKDPRICRIAPLWFDAFDQAGIHPVVVFPVRNPREVAASLERRDGFHPGLGHLLWLRHALDGEHASRGRPRSFLSYDQLLSERMGVVEAMQEQLGLTWPRVSPKVAEEINGFLSDKYRHHRDVPESVFNDSTLSSWIRDSFAILHRWTQEGEAEADWPELDRIRGELDIAAPAFATVVDAGRKAAQRVKKIEAELQEVSAATETLRNDAEMHTQKIEILQRELREATRLQTEARAEVERSKARVQERIDEITKLTRLLRDAEDKLLSGSGSAASEPEDAQGSSFARLHARLMKPQKATFLPARIRTWPRVQMLKSSGLFDAKWYLENNPDVAAAGANPEFHYVMFGAQEGRAPNPRLRGY